jgi:hypothetical protein
MVTLDSLEKIIRNNYKYIQDPRVLLAVETFLKENPVPTSVQGLTASNAANIAKMASFARKEWLVQKAGAEYGPITWITALNYCKFGINRIENGHMEPTFSTPESRKLMRCILYDNAGNIALQLAQLPAETFRKDKHLKDAMHFYSAAIGIASEMADQKIVAYTFAYRGNVQKQLGELAHGTERINLFVSAANDTLESGRRTREYDKRHAAYQYSIASKLLFRTAAAATRTPGRQIELLKNAIAHQQTALELHELNPRFQAEADYDIAKYYDLLFKITQKTDDARSALKHYELAEKWLSDDKPIKQTAARRIEELKMVCA